MPKGYKAEKPIYNYINPQTVNDDILSIIYKTLDSMGFDKYGKDKDIPKRTISHNQLNYCFRQVYNQLFKPKEKLYNNQASLIDYNNIDQLQAIAESFLNVCGLYNKSLGLMSFSYLTGIAPDTLRQWRLDEKVNPKRSAVIKYIQEGHKAAQISLLNDSPVGALAVANNDIETGLEWATKQAVASGSSAVFLIPSERLNRLGVTASEPVALPVMAEQEKAKS